MDYYQAMSSEMVASTRAWLNITPAVANVTKREFDVLGPMYFTLHMITMVLVYFGNILTIVAVAKFSALQTVTNTFMVSLSISDLLVAVIMPYCCILNHTHVIREVSQLKTACLTCSSFLTISKVTSLFNLMAVTVDRYLLVNYPLRYVHIMTQRRAGVIVAALWIYVSVFSLVFIWTFDVWNKNKYCSLIKVVPVEIYAGFYLTNILICITITITIQARIFHIARKTAKEIAVQNAANAGSLNKKEAKITRMMALVTGVFLLCWATYTVFNILRSFVEDAPPWLDITYKLSLSLLHCNSFMNPIIYGWKNKMFRDAFKQLLFYPPPKN